MTVGPPLQSYCEVMAVTVCSGSPSLPVLPLLFTFTFQFEIPRPPDQGKLFARFLNLNTEEKPSDEEPLQYITIIGVLT